MGAQLSARPRRLSKSLIAIGLLPALLAASGCRLWRDGDGEDAGSPSADLEADPFGADRMDSFDNAAEAILASRPMAASAAAQDLEEAFKSGDYRASLEQARSLAEVAPPGSEDLDAAVFVEGASLYYLGRHAEAQQPLDRHRAEFPDSRYKESSRYYSGSNLVKQARWREGGGALDDFINRYPESLLMEYALYDRATAHYALGEFEECYRKAARLESDFIYSKIRDRAAILRAEVLRKRARFPESEAAFLKAKNAADSLGHPGIAARALAGLISVSAEQERWDDSIEYYETFFDKYAASPQAPAAAQAGLRALREKGRVQEGLSRMESVLLAMPPGTSARIFKTALATYADYFRQEHGAEELLRRYANLSSTGEGSDTLREQLIIARLEVLETHFPERTAEISVFYEEVRSRFERSELATPTVLKMADHIAREEPQQAMAWYEEALSRRESQYQDVATLGLAKAHAASQDPRSLARAESLFRRVVESFGSPELLEEAVLGLARVSTRQQKWAQARDYWARYLEQSDWDLARDEAKRKLSEASRRAGSTPPRPGPESRPQPPRPSVPPEPESAPESAPEARPALPPQVRPAKPPVGGALSARRAELKLQQAERLVAGGRKAEAYELLKSQAAPGAGRAPADPALASTLRRSALLEARLRRELDPR